MAKEDEKPVQNELPGTPKAQRPKSVREDGKMLAEYIRPHYGKTSQGEYFVGMEFSFPLTEDHEDLVPEEVLNLWEIQQKRGTPRRAVDLSVDPQMVEIFLAPDIAPELTLIFALITHASLTIVEETGSGKARDVIRYSFRVQHPSAGSENDALREFADNHFDKGVWIRLKEVQGSLLKAHRDAEKKANAAKKD